MFEEKKRKKITILHMQIIDFTAVKNCSLLHGRIFVMRVLFLRLAYQCSSSAQYIVIIPNRMGWCWKCLKINICNFICQKDDKETSDLVLYTASKVKHHLNIFLEKTVNLFKHELILVTFLKRD